MGWLNDALKFEFGRGKEIFSELKSHPQRLFMGALDPLGTKIYNTVWGSHFEPLGDQLGGPTETQYANAEDRGLNTGPARTMNGIAHVVAALYGGNALGAAAGGGAGAGAGGGTAGAAGATGSNLGTYARLAQGVVGAMNRPGGTSVPSATPPINNSPQMHTQDQTQMSPQDAAAIQKRKSVASILRNRLLWGG
jgi:hypothetical protein